MALLIASESIIYITASFFVYGVAANEVIANKIANDIKSCWNNSLPTILIKRKTHQLFFDIKAEYILKLNPSTVVNNIYPAHYFVRVENFVDTNVSFVDGVGSNTGYFKLENLLQTPTTVAHEFGHMLGLDHPKNLDIRGNGLPGIMYPRGTICDAKYQYDSTVSPGVNGGTLNPDFRKITNTDIELLSIASQNFINGISTLGKMTNIYHQKH